MWFDPKAKLAEIAGHPPATSATLATQYEIGPPMSQKSRVSQAPEPAKTALRFVPPSAMTSQNCNQFANEILDALRDAQTGEELDRVVTQYRKIIEAIKNMPEPLDSVRAIHIQNLETLRRGKLKEKG